MFSEREPEIVRTEKTVDPAVRIPSDAEFTNVACVVVYANDEDAIFYDKEFKKHVKEEDYLNLFFNGVVAAKDGTYYSAKSYTEAGTIDFGFPQA